MCDVRQVGEGGSDTHELETSLQQVVKMESGICSINNQQSSGQQAGSNKYRCGWHCILTYSRRLVAIQLKSIPSRKFTHLS